MVSFKADSVKEKRPGLLCSARFNLALVMFLGCVVIYALRTNISFAVVCMVDSSGKVATAGDGGGPAPEKCNSNSTFINFFRQNDAPTSSEQAGGGGEFHWSKSVQGTILSAFFWGYMTSQILGGWLAQRVGAKRVVGGAILASSLLTLATPPAARWHVGALIVVRVALGFLQGAIFPAMHSMWALWAPPLERSLLTGVSYAGAQIGIVVVMPLSGVLCRYGVDGGWPSIFYALGAVGVAWSVLWAFGVADTPQAHRRISECERAYIVYALADGGGVGGAKEADDDTEKAIRNSSGGDNDREDALMDKDDDGQRSTTRRDARRPNAERLPLRAVLTSAPVWACFIGHFAGDWGAYTMATGLPTYMNDALGLDLASMGMLSALPYVVYFVIINLGGFVADYLQNSGVASTLSTRRLAMIVALGGQALFLVAIGYVRCGDEVWLIALLTASVGVSGFQYSGFIVNYLDICPRHVGTVLGLGQTLSCVAGVLAPLCIGYLTPTGSRDEWQTVFYVTAFILAAGALFFCVFASGSVQPWAVPSLCPSGNALAANAELSSEATKMLLASEDK